MKPIGYWFSHLHQLLESSFADALAEDGLTRRHWQVLNTIASGARTSEAVDEALAPFGSSMKPIVDDLIERGWVADGQLTEAGQAAFERARAKIQKQRELVTEGISDEDYRTTHDVLERMARNLTKTP
ncbi:DNA-binding transcriptional regulator, MarR family [Amycolatopsis xylanica]|uniref:DNA-binding transcriptional regulator, MarR family n=1 Tax=Amycolatopsis xylanica TaxID=589385 RepID=A0A1H3AMQ3_9PSEU|nr:MarR family winged helix-turn-helix transcriptional regulator [Amycolatopsis xylanica]SDX31020.1 DNA-binding transcriptional regulator, MarR family [Amycolatopsis xylanica]